MASKNLGAVIQRAISDGAFRRQLQSDPAAALRGFNLTPDEVAAIRSGDSSKLMSLGVDQRMSKAFTVGGGFLGATRSTTSDLGAGATSSTIASDATAGTREGLVDPTVSGTRAIHDDAPADLRSAATTGDLSGTRAVNDVAPFEGSVNAMADPTLGGTRAVNDIAPFEGNVNAAASNGTTGGPGGSQLSADDNFAVSSRMADAGDATSVRPINDVAPFEGNVDAVATGSDPMLGDARLDPGIDGSHADGLSAGGGNTSS
jgi:hypothetical protein